MTAGHRPWAVPDRPWVWRQSWLDVLFAHWPISVETLRPLVPDALTIQEFDGTAWIGVVPFHMQNIAPRFVPALPWISAFPELNVRTYVEMEGKPGVWFFSLDATNPLAVWAARRFFHLSYHRAEMSFQSARDQIEYRYRRLIRNGLSPRFEGNYGPTSSINRAAPGSLDHWLTERYCLYAEAPDGKIYRSEMHHAPWPLQQARAEIEANTMTEPLGIALSGPPATLHFGKRVDVILWSPERLH
jgi:uncharacterized protein YqjF (DUF2071 family)